MNIILSIIIPVFNEKGTILELLKNIEEENPDKPDFKKEIIIVDDGSNDGTRLILEAFRQRYKILYHTENRGKEKAIETGLRNAKGNFVLIQDADLEYSPKDYKNLLRPVLEKNALVVYGSRWLNPKNRHPNKLFYLGGLFLTYLANFLYKQKITDILTGYKLLETKILKKINFDYSRFEFCCEITAKLSKKGLRIAEVPIDYYPRQQNQKKIKLLDGFKMIFVLLRYKFGN